MLPLPSPALILGPVGNAVPHGLSLSMYRWGRREADRDHLFSSGGRVLLLLLPLLLLLLLSVLTPRA